MLNLFSGMVLHRSMFNWRGEALVYVHSGYMYNLFSVMLLQRSVFDWRGVHLPWVYVYSAICKTYSV